MAAGGHALIRLFVATARLAAPQIVATGHERPGRPFVGRYRSGSHTADARKRHKSFGVMPDDFRPRGQASMREHLNGTPLLVAVIGKERLPYPPRRP